MMKLPILAVIAVISTNLAMAQVSSTTLLSPGTTLPVQFERSIDSNHAHAGDVISAKTIQQIRLANGQVLPAGTHITGHVVAASAFRFDKTLYAKQQPSTLTIHFDSIQSKGETFPLQVSVRAMADPLTVWDAARPKASDMDPLGTTTQIGGDQVTPSQSEVVSQDGDTVGYLRHGGVYAHLISASGNGPGSCDASNTEQSMGPFSASACGLYGFTNVSLVETGSTGIPSTLTLVSRRGSPKIWAKSAVLLEVAGPQTNMAFR
jgi:hypothetical protein